jgi:uncharacterized membrane protein
MKTSVKVMISGILLLIGGLVLGVGGTLAGLVGSYERVVESAASPSPKQLSEGVNLAFVSTAIGVPMAFVGFGLIIAGVIAWFVGRRSST